VEHLENLDLVPGGALVSLGVLLAVLPLALVILVPAAILRRGWRKYHATWAGARAFVVAGAYRGRTLELESPPRVSPVVVVAALVSLYFAVPAVLASPYIALLADDDVTHYEPGPAVVFGVAGVLIVIAAAHAGYALLRVARTSARAARIVATVELVFAQAFALAVLEWDALSVDDGRPVYLTIAALLAAQSLLLFAGAAANDRASVRACT
jgi:hypothetical protein